MLDELKRQVLEANLQLPKYRLITFTWGNVSAIDRKKGLIIIKPSGVEYDKLKIEDIVVVNFDGNVIEGKYKPSSDTPTHIELYKAFPKIGGVVHTHSSYATSFAQACKEIKAYGTTHADYFYGNIPCTRILTETEIQDDYEKNTGIVIAEALKDIDENAMPGILVANHGVFSWGENADTAVHNAVVIEEVAKMACRTELINPEIKEINRYILDKHYNRKHGKDAYYGQNSI